MVVYIGVLQVSIQQELALQAQHPHSRGLLFPIAVDPEVERASGQCGARPPVAAKPEPMMSVLSHTYEQFVSVSAAFGGISVFNAR